LSSHTLTSEREPNSLKKIIKNERKRERKSKKLSYSNKIKEDKGLSLESCVSSSSVVPQKPLKHKNKISYDRTTSLPSLLQRGTYCHQ